MSWNDAQHFLEKLVCDALNNFIDQTYNVLPGTVTPLDLADE